MKMGYDDYLACKFAVYSFIIISFGCAILHWICSDGIWWILEVCNAITLLIAGWIQNESPKRIPDYLHMHKTHNYIESNETIYIKKDILGIRVYVPVDCSCATLNAFIDYKIKWQAEHPYQNDKGLRI